MKRISPLGVGDHYFAAEIYRFGQDVDNGSGPERAEREEAEREAALRSLGLVKVRGALGGAYWE